MGDSAMILRRLTQHVKDQDWFAVVLDFLIVVAGILIAFQITAWSEARAERRMADAYLDRLLADLRAEADLYDGHIAYNEAVQRHAQDATQALEGGAAGLGAAFLVDAYQATQVVSFSPVRGTYDELLAVGAINSLPDITLRERLDAYYQLTTARAGEWAVRTPYRDTVRAYIPDVTQRAIHDRCESFALGAAVLDEDCEPDLGPAEVEAALERILSVGDLWAQANHNLAGVRVKLLLFRAQRDDVGDVIAYMEAAGR